MLPTNKTYHHHIGDTLTPVYAQLQRVGSDDAIENVDLTGKTVTFKMVNSAGTAIVSETAATVVTAATGIVSYDFQSADVATAGVYYGYFRVADGGEKDTYPVVRKEFKIIVHAD